MSSGLSVVRDLREVRRPASPEELADYETDLLAGFVLARSSAGLSDGTIRGEVSNLEQVREWFGRPLWEMDPADANAYFGRVMRAAASGTRHARAGALVSYFAFLELRHQAELHALTGRVVTCPVDEMNRPKGRKDAQLRIPPREEEVARLFTGWAGELAACRKFAPTARNYAAARLMSQIGLRANEVRRLDLADVKGSWGRSGRSTSATARAHAGPGRVRGWSR